MTQSQMYKSHCRNIRELKVQSNMTLPIMTSFIAMGSNGRKKDEIPDQEFKKSGMVS